MIQEEMQSLYAIINAGLDKISYAVKSTSSIDNTDIIGKWRLYQAGRSMADVYGV